MKNILIKFSLIIFFVVLFGNFALVFANNVGEEDIPYKNYEAEILKVIDERENENSGYYQKLQIKILNGDLKNQIFEVENGLGESPVTQKFNVKDKVVLVRYDDGSGSVGFFIDDYVRRSSMIFLFFIFIILAIVIAGKKGFTSFLGMIITFLMIFWLVLPQISTGANPLLITLIFSSIAIPVTFYLSHGFSKKTNVAVAGTFISLVITVVLSSFFVNAAKLTGFTSDEASFLQLLKGDGFSMRGILLAGIIIGMLGVLDDITISQSAIVFQLKEANSKLNFSELYKRSMDVGKDHIASMINTLVLVYTGASLPLLLLFTDSTHTFGEVVNYEIIASEVIRTLLGSIGLVLAVPVTTFIAASIAEADKGV